MARVAPQPVGWSASVASTRGLGVTRSRTSTAAPSTAAPLVVVPVAYHARSSRRGRRANRKPRLSPDDRVESAVTVRVRRDCPGDTRVGMLGDGAGGVLGKWDTSKVAPMRRSREDPALWEWVLAVPIGATLEFKLVTVDPGDAVVRWSPGAAIRVDVPRGCAGVDVDIDWPEPRANAAVAGTADRAGAILSVRQKATVEKPLHEYRVETGGAWLAYGNKSTDDDDETETEAEERTETNGGTAAHEHDAKDALGGTPHARSDEESNESSSRVVVDALDAVDLDAEGTAERHTAGLFVRADVSADENDARFVSADENETDAFLSVDESSDDDDAEETEAEETEPEETEPSASDSASDSTSASDVSDAKETREARRAAGYVVGSHLENMSGGKKTELVVNAADSRRRGIRVGVVEDGRLVETWYEDSAGPGEGMRVGDVYLGVVAKVIGGMQGVLVDVTGKGPPYSLMQKGVDEPALAWREADAGYERDVELERREIERARKGEAATSAASAADVDENNADEASSPSPSLGLPSGPKEDAQSAASDARLARLERKAAASAIGSRAGGRWADAWAEGVGVSDSFDGESVAAPSSAETVAASLETFAEERTETDGGVGVATTKTTTKTSVTETLVEETRVPPPFAWAPWRRGGGASRAAEASNDDADSSGEASPALDSSASPRASVNATSASDRRASLTAAERRGGRGVVDDWVPGMPVVVQVTRLGSGHKGPRVTARPTLPGRNVVLCPDGEGVYVSRKLAGAARAYVKSVGAEVAPPDCALIMRTEAAGVSKEVLATDITSLAADWHEVKRRAEMAVAASGEHGRSPMPRRLLDAATTEQILVRDLFGERVARLVVDSKKARDAIVEDLRKTGATEETVKKVELWQPPEGSENEDHEKGAFKPPEVWDALCLRDAIASAEEERVFLKDENLPGAHLVIQQTEALTAVDVNAGRAAFVNDGNTESVAFAVNVAAAAELAAQLRLRDVGGLVMIDFIDMTKRKHRRLVEAAFLDAAKHDRAQVTFLPISPLGVMEVARERLQGNHAGRFVVADEKGMPVDPDRPAGGPRRVRGPRPPPWVRGRGPKDGGHNTPNAATRDERARASDGEYSDEISRAGAYDGNGNARGFRGFRESSRRRERGSRGAVANHSGSFYGGARRGRGGGKARGGQKHAGSGDGA